MWSLWQMSAESRCCIAFERKRERDREREREKARVFTIQDHDPHTRLASNAYEVGGRRDPRYRLSASATAQMNECGRTRDWRGKSAPLWTSVSHSTPYSSLPPTLLSFPPALFPPPQHKWLLAPRSMYKLWFVKIDLRWWTRQFSEVLL